MMKKFAGLLLGAAFVGMPLLAHAADAIDAKAVFTEYKCNKCHSVESAGVAKVDESDNKKAPDLTGIMDGLDRAWLEKYLHRLAENKEGKKHPKDFKGSDEEFKAILDWLAEQKKKESP